MSIKIISEDFPLDENGNNNKYFKASELIAQMELDSISDPLKEKIKLVYKFYHGDPDWIPNVKIVKRECSEKIISKTIETKVNSRLLQIVNSDEMEFYDKKTDQFLYDIIKGLPQIIKLKKEATERKKSTENFFNSMPDGSPLIENTTSSNKVLFLLMAASNKKIHPEAAQRIQALLYKVE